MTSRDTTKLVGYAAGVFDFFHIGHLNLLRNAKSLCETLVVGVSTDELVLSKGRAAVFPYTERAEIIRACSFVDCVVPQDNFDKYVAWQKLKFDILFVGDDWYQSEKWKEYERKLNKEGVKVVYFPYTQGTSSTIINETLKTLHGEISKKGVDAQAAIIDLNLNVHEIEQLARLVRGVTETWNGAKSKELGLKKQEVMHLAQVLESHEK